MNAACWTRDFGLLIDLTVPQSGVAILLSAYFDASEREGGVFSVAGFAFGAGRAKKAATRWHRLWGDTLCHMTELHTRPKGSAFEHWTGEKAGARLKDSVTVINRYASYGVAVSCNINEVAALAPKSTAAASEHFLGGFRTAYATCCHMAMSSLGKVVSENSDSRVAYFFEMGDKHQGEAERFWNLVSLHDLMAEYYRHLSHTVIKKSDCRLLEMADIFAWEWAKHRERQESGLSMRGSLAAILGKGCNGPIDFASDNRRAIHLTGEPLERYFSQVKKLILS